MSKSISNNNTLMNRGHFFAAAAAAMRSVLVDHARRRGALKRGGDQPRVVFDDSIDGAADLSGEVVAVNDALEELEKSEPRKGRIVELFYFAGLSIDEIAGLLELSRRTVDRDLRFARRLLQNDRTRSRAQSAQSKKFDCRESVHGVQLPAFRRRCNRQEYDRC